MDVGSRKLQIIDAVLKTESEDVLTAIEQVMKEPSRTPQSNKQFQALAKDPLTPQEAEDLKKIIEENFEKVNPHDW